MVTLDTLQREKRNETLRLGVEHGARSIRVFGSVARSENREGSDVDLLVEFDAGSTLFQRIGPRLDLRDLLGAEVDIVTPNRLRYLRARVLAEARAL